MGSIDDPMRLYSEVEHRWGRLDAYYGVLNEDHEFAADLRRLYQRVDLVVWYEHNRTAYESLGVAPPPGGIVAP